MSMKKYATEEFKLKVIKAIESSSSMNEAAAKVDVHYNTFYRHAKKLGLWQPNQAGKGMNKMHNGSKIPLDDILEGKHPQYKTGHLKRRLYKVGLKENVCEECGLGSEWRGKPIVHELDHINGNSRDHRLENLRVLCLHCHSQTPTFRGRNIKK